MVLLHRLQAPVHRHCHLLLRPLLLCCLQAGKAGRQHKAAKVSKKEGNRIRPAF
jgi:hypothetical protein